MSVPLDIADMMRRIVGEGPSCVAVLDAELRYVATSRTWLAQFGGGHAALEGLRHYDVVPGIPERWKEIHRRALAGESLSADEDLFVLPDGRRMWLRWSVHPWRDTNDAIAGIVIGSEDITARKEMEEALRDSEERYRTLVETAPNAIFLHQDRRIVYVNGAALTLFGARDAAELVGRPVWDVIDPSCHELVRGRIASLEQRGILAVRQDVTTRGLSGEIREAEVSASPATFAGKPAIQVVMRDVTDERCAAAAAREAAARLAAIVTSAMDAILGVDDGLHIVLANPAAESLFGYAKDALLGQPLSVLVPERYRADHDERVRAFGRSGLSRRGMGPGVITGRHADGHEIPLEVSISQSEVGGKKLYIAIHRDVRPRLEVERALRAGEERFRQLAESIREVFWLTDVEKTAVVYASPAYESIFGRPVAELYEKPRSWLDAIHAQDRPAVLAAALRQADGAYDVEYRVVRPDGSVCWVHDRAFPVRDESGRVVRIAGVAEDITGRHILEEQFRQTQKLESVGRLAGGVAHDFNNLLTVIVSSAELLRAIDLPGEARELIDDVLDAGLRGGALTRQLLAFSRQEVIEPRVMNLDDVVTDAEKLLRRLIGEDIELVTKLDAASAPVSIDPGQWTQVLFNLAVNARDAMPRRGRLSLETDVHVVHEHEHTELAPGRYTRLRVTDSGSGMTPEVRARLFEPFFTTKPHGKGTGLGLAVVYGVVHQAGGHIDVSSEPGEGASFTVDLPSSAAAEARPRETTAPSAGAGEETILVVEDEEPVRRVVARVLERAGYRVLTAADAEDARAVFDAHDGPIDLLVTDVIMPGDDGPTLAASLVARMPGLRVLYTSGYLGDALGSRGISADSLLHKPYSPAILRDRVRRMLDAG